MSPLKFWRVYSKPNSFKILSMKFISLQYKIQFIYLLRIYDIHSKFECFTSELLIVSLFLSFSAPAPLGIHFYRIIIPVVYKIASPFSRQTKLLIKWKHHGTITFPKYYHVTITFELLMNNIGFIIAIEWITDENSLISEWELRASCIIFYIHTQTIDIRFIIHKSSHWWKRRASIHGLMTSFVIICYVNAYMSTAGDPIYEGYNLLLKCLCV